ncbi:MAG: prolyl oligopeptidase family serine peptidase [Verrucomicrobiota bacterium]
MLPRLSLYAFASAALVLVFGSAFALAQEAATYRTPSPALAAIVDAPTTPLAVLSPDRRELLFLERSEAPSIAELAQPELRLAGLRINPVTNGPSRGLSYTGIVLKNLATAAERRVTGLPAGARIANYEWSLDGKNFAFTLTREKGIELWIVEAATAKARRLTGPILNATFGDPLAWLDNTTILALRIPEGRGPAPAAPTVPSGPVVQETGGRRAPARTYDGLLTSPYDEALFEHYATAQPVLVSLNGGLQNYGAPGLYNRTSASPDGNYVIVESVHRPFSYVVPSSRFPSKTEVLDRNGRSAKLVIDTPLLEAMPPGGVRVGPRLVTWRADKPATLSWVQALDKGDANSTEPRRDAWYTQPVPFTASAVEQQRFEYRVQSITWGDDALATVVESWTRTRKTRTWRVAPGEPGGEPVLLSERSSQDRYNDPGRPVLVRNNFGRLVIQRSEDGGKIFLEGTGASPQGDRPFVDELELATKQTHRLWRSEPPYFEEFVAFLDKERTQMLTRRESTTSPGNYVVHPLAGGEPRAITSFPNPYPQFDGLAAEVIHYKRADGVALSGKLYLPPGYKPGQGPLPTLLWAYPREFLSEETASQVNATPERFARLSPSSALPFLLVGYAVLDDPAMPIVGRDGKQPNDTYIEQLVANAQAAIDELVRRGVTDQKRVAVGGHSYGAFMTANLLAHSRLFRAGIARSGAYNRTLTPFGFQSEDRNFWQAPAVYAAMSPFNYANKLKDPILLIHGAADNNSGTFPIQSERFYAALKGHGAPARYVVLPHESHGYRARESLLHMLWETETWLDTHVKNPPKAAAK